ncbi:hypothetical protein KR50_12220 [Jeotgalibacillus campisalis]|uniref:Uncharacterized protein n=1 Tax=Jeotgalibacillus campisalis TaxID=220754 RepID=A0A0C2VJX3_9BACL|nr:hypothetical protein KR50_12220 [Jeotgalibacillus campisalis]
MFCEQGTMKVFKKAIITGGMPVVMALIVLFIIFMSGKV